MYIDPNTGGQLFAALATFLALFSGMILVFSGKIRAFFARMRRNARQDESMAGGEPAESQPKSDLNA